jgi:hypothetical protein
MSRIICVHGIAQEYKSRETLLEEWAPALCGGVSNAGGRLDSTEIDMAFYGILFRPLGAGVGAKGNSGTIPDYAPGDLADPFEIDLLRSLYDGSLAKNADAETIKGGAARSVAGMLQAVAKTPFFGSVAQKVVIWQLKQVSKYVSDPAIKAAARKAAISAIGEDTRILVGHSLGSVVAWETLCANPDLPIRTLITLGSPLGVPVLLPRLDPPVKEIPGAWPKGITRWINIADGRDVVALEKRLSNVFSAKVEDYLVENGATMHDISPYLTSRELGASIMTSLT